MINSRDFTYTILVFFIAIFSSFAQTETIDEEALSLEKSSVSGQFDFVTKNSSGWSDERGQRYEVVKVQYLSELKKHVLDSLQEKTLQINKSLAEIKTQQTEINTLKKSLANTKSNLSDVKEEKDSMNFLGMNMSKASYSTMLFGIILLLLALCAFFAFKFKNSNVVTKEAKTKLAEVELEYDDHRKTALEREQKVRRQLQDEINKNRNK